jgi:tRNA-2-methylthio-N6-dimethylallyladenosine synthase
VREITLLGQTVNAYGRHDVRRGPRGGSGTESFATLLRRLADVPGIERIRYTSPHPAFFDDDLVRAHGELAPLCPHVHLPAQSGSDAVLARMRRPYTARRLPRAVRPAARARPDVALTTDLIVGFPGETDADFAATLALVRDVAFVDAYTFKYSPRPNTPPRSSTARSRPRSPRRGSRSSRTSCARSRSRPIGAASAARPRCSIEGDRGRRGEQASGRDPYHRVVNLAAEAESIAPGELVPVRVVEATPHSLIGEMLAPRDRIAGEERRRPRR